MVGPGGSWSGGQRLPSIELLLPLAFVARLCGCRLLDQAPGVLRPTGPPFGYSWLYPADSLLHLLSGSPHYNLSTAPVPWRVWEHRKRKRCLLYHPCCTAESLWLCPLLCWRPLRVDLSGGPNKKREHALTLCFHPHCLSKTRKWGLLICTSIISQTLEGLDFLLHCIFLLS